MSDKGIDGHYVYDQLEEMKRDLFELLLCLVDEEDEKHMPLFARSIYSSICKLQNKIANKEESQLSFLFIFVFCALEEDSASHQVFRS